MTFIHHGRNHLVRLVLALSLSPACAIAQNKNATNASKNNSDLFRVEATGRGTTRWLARSDAVSKIWEATMKQLVIADPKVSRDDVKLGNEVSLAVTGFAHEFLLLGAKRTVDGWELRYLAEFSKSWLSSKYLPKLRAGAGSVAATNDTIELAVTGGAAGGRAVVNGNAMIAAISAHEEKQSANFMVAGAALDAFFFPVNAIIASIDNVQVIPGADEVRVSVGLRYDPAFLKSLREVAEAMPMVEGVGQGRIGVVYRQKEQNFHVKFDVFYDLDDPVIRSTEFGLLLSTEKFLFTFDSLVTVDGKALPPLAVETKENGFELDGDFRAHVAYTLPARIFANVERVDVEVTNLVTHFAHRDNYGSPPPDVGFGVVKRSRSEGLDTLEFRGQRWVSSASFRDNPTRGWSAIPTVIPKGKLRPPPK